MLKIKKVDAHFWSTLMDVKNMFLERGRFSVQDGSQTRFWEDLWLGDEPLMTLIERRMLQGIIYYVLSRLIFILGEWW
jgi:hypothetical protein